MILRKNIRRDRDAGIEGLPLQLMIMVAVAGLGMAIILGWMGGLSAPNGISAVYSSPNEIVLNDSDHDGVFTASGRSITITVMDTKGEPVGGATVVLDGCNLQTSGGRQVHGTTDDAGKVMFNGLSASQTGKSVGFVTVTVTKSGMGTDNTLTIPVISE
ncbi:MAG: carboxypeptidase regulatory-like domain-containing protein [Methanomassiliicoccus sp.]|nr:carboxypeptidase regulatory-like domain-containing protein [Methanomassiliicoccus sp.]